MINKLTEWAWKQKISSEAKLTLLSLIHTAYENKSCLTYGQISKKTGLDIQESKKAIDTLIKHGLIILISEEQSNTEELPEYFQKQIKTSVKRNGLPRTYAFVCDD